MLDMGFEPQIRNIVERADMPIEGRQTMMFSATFPRNVVRIADSFLYQPVMLRVGRVGGAASSVTQVVLYVSGHDKTRTCVDLLQRTPGKTIVFVNTKRSADQLEYELGQLGCPSASVSAKNKNEIRQMNKAKHNSFPYINTVVDMVALFLVSLFLTCAPFSFPSLYLYFPYRCTATKTSASASGL